MMADILDPRFFRAERPCAHGHEPLRYVNSRKCVFCVRESLARQAATHPERKRAHNRKAYEKRAAQHRAYAQSYREQNREQTRATVRAWQARNRERIAESNKAWWRANPDKVAQQHRTRRARKAAVEATLTREEVRELVSLQGSRCAICRVKTKLTLDHIVPLSKGGAHVRANAQMLCRPCNSAKRDRDMITFAQSRGLLL